MYFTYIVALIMLINYRDDLYGRRIDQVLAQESIDRSRAFWQKSIKNGCVFIDGAPILNCDYKIRNGDAIVVHADLSAEHSLVIQGEKMDLNIVYDDADIAVINKIAGLTVHPGAGIDSGTLVHGLVERYGDNLSHAGTVRPGIVHRLDRWTSGLMIIAKNDRAHMILSEMIKKREVKRAYKAVVYGQPSPTAGVINAPIARSRFDRCKMAVSDGGKDSVTRYRMLSSNRYVSLVECVLETGRTHQIRVHMKHIGHCLVGDAVYEGRKINIGKGADNTIVQSVKIMQRQALHASRLAFLHPTTSLLHEYHSDLPQDMLNLVSSCKL